MSRPRVRPWPALRATLAPALFAAALTGCHDPGPAPRAAVPLAVPLAASAAPAGESPRLLRGGTMPARPAATAAEAAIAHVQALAPQWGAPGGLAELAPVGTLAVRGGEIVRLRQAVDGIPVERGELRVLIGPGGALLAASGVPVPAALPRDGGAFVHGRVREGREAVARAVAAIHDLDAAAAVLAAHPGPSEPADPASWFAGDAAGVHVSEARARRAWYRDGDALTAAWIVEAYTGPADATDAELHRVVLAARNGRVLDQANLTVDAEFDYRVWAEATGDRRPLDGPVADYSPHPTGAPGAGRPAFVAPTLVTIDGLNRNPQGAADPWLAAGATETRGNNVDAYTDINSPNGFSANDFRATVTAPGAFDRVYDTQQGPLVSTEQQMAAIAQLFYSINWLHDVWYDAGFTEAAGNAQLDNYGRGGVAGDVLLAEAQDSANQGRRNNANMSTPSDGMSPRMQVYLWSGQLQQSVTLSSVAGEQPATTSSAYGPGSYDVTGVVVAGVDGGGASSLDGCEPLTGDVTGRIVVVDRGNCTFKRKSLNAQNAGAAGLFIANNTGTSPPTLANDTAISEAITIPTMGLSMAAGAALRTAVGVGDVTAHLFRLQGIEADGALDGGLVAHEFGHYLHHRLSVCGTVQCGGMSEGWGDFLTLHLLARPGDDLRGAYSIAAHAFNGDPYFGIRRAPYSVDTSKNALTYAMVADGVPLPTSHPTRGGGVNSQVHNTGEIWAGALWEVYVALLEVPGADFAETRARMARYVVGGLLLAPPDGTFTEIRDAILAAAQAASPADHDVMAAAFARRGLGSCAASPPRAATDNVGATEDFTVSARVLPGAATVALTADCDADGSLDAGDTAIITIPVVNAGALALASGAEVTVSTTTAGLVVPATPVAVGALAPYGATAASFEVAVSGDVAAGPLAGAVEVTITAPGCTPTSTFTVPLRMQTDVRSAASAADAFDAVPSVWTPRGEAADQVWSHAVEAGLDRWWAGAAVGTTADASLESPDLVASADEPVVITFDHRFEFEFSEDTYWDGGVIELSTDGGVSWSDVSTWAAPGYTGTIGGDSGNPLDGRSAFGATNPSFPALDRVTLDLGAALAGQTFRLRFRIGTDGAVGAPGWRIDDLAITGLSSTPFPVQIGEDGACGPGGDAGTDPGDEPGGCCSTGGARAGDLAVGLVALALVAWPRRRRRRAP